VSAGYRHPDPPDVRPIRDDIERRVRALLEEMDIDVDPATHA
jgi:hypothetical protein